MRNAEKKSRPFAKRLRRNLTDAETILWSRLRRDPRHKFRRQHPAGRYIADFACIAARLIVEIDGATHSSDAQIDYDRAREAYLRRQGWEIIRVQNDDVYKRLNDVLDAIIGAALARTQTFTNEAPPPPSCAQALQRAPPPPAGEEE